MAPKPNVPLDEAPNNAVNVEAPKPDGELQRRVQLAIFGGDESPKVDRYTGKLACYHTITLAPVGQPDAIDPNRIKVGFQPGSLKCMGKECSRWNAEALECYDNTQAKASYDTARILDLIDGHARMSQGEK